MRKILFRGKRVDNGEWVCGYLHIKYFQEMPHDRFVIEHEPKHNSEMWQPKYMVAEIGPETVGQFTGLADMKGKRIFEGDIVKDESGVVYPVVYGLTGFYLKYAPPHSHGFHYDLLPLSNYWHAHGAIIEVIGNIHDNPELLEVADNA